MRWVVPVTIRARLRRIRILRAAAHRVRRLRGKAIFVGGLLNCYRYDLWRYYRAASKGHEAVLSGRSRFIELRSWIIADSHKIEKGLALRDPRPGFGKPYALRLYRELARFHDEYAADCISMSALNVLSIYCRFNREQGCADVDFEKQVASMIESLLPDTDAAGGVLAISRNLILQRSLVPGIGEFFNSRHSIRNFSDAPVAMSLIENAIRLASKTPSVCNRQSWKAYVYLGQEAAREVLACQHGNGGFGHMAAGVLVITSDIRTFFSYAERNQGFVDGAMFAMSVVYGLHAQGLGSCCLNWCVELSSERKLREVTNIPECELVVMMIAVGHLPDTLFVAQSVRKPLDELCIRSHVSAKGKIEDVST